MICLFFFFKQKTAYEMRISDWSSDVCSSDLIFHLTFTMRADNQMWRLMFSRDAIFAGIGRESLRPVAGNTNRSDLAIVFSHVTGARDFDVNLIVIGSPQIGRASCREEGVRTV